MKQIHFLFGWLLVLTVVSMLWLQPVPVSADAGIWTKIGPNGNVVSVAVDPTNEQIVYAAGADGVWKSSDRGTTWLLVNTTRALRQIAVDRFHPQTLYAVDAKGPEEKGAIVKSSDGGTTWTEILNTGTRVVLDPNLPNVLYVYHATPGPYHGNGCIYAGWNPDRSTDGGSTWTQIHPLWDPTCAGSILAGIAPVPGVDDRLDVAGGVYHGGYLATTTNATAVPTPTWTITNPADRFSSETFQLSPHGIAAARDGTTTFTYLIWSAIGGDGILRLENDQQAQFITRTIPYRNNNPFISSLTVDAQHGSQVYTAVQTGYQPFSGPYPKQAGIFASPDRGETWIELGTVAIPVVDLELAPVSQVLYAVTDTGQIYRYTHATPVAARFIDFYTTHDGARLLGGALGHEQVVNGYHTQYFEKGRIEDHQGESSDPNWRCMYGLLVDELQQAEAKLPIGGNTSTLTYANLHTLADPGQRIEPPTGYPGQGVWMHTVADVFVPFTPDLRGGRGHLVLMGFWNYINRADLFPGGWLHDVGLPISEPQQVVVTKNLLNGPVQRLITVQAFQRTILTYDPLNPPDWRIERANVGSDYQKAFPERVGP